MEGIVLYISTNVILQQQTSCLRFHELEGIPEDGTDAEFDVAGLQVKITKVENHLVEAALVTKVD